MVIALSTRYERFVKQLSVILSDNRKELSMSKQEKAQAIVNMVDCSHDVDLTLFERGELKSLRDSIDDLLKTRVKLEKLTPPGDILYSDFVADK